jgi:hypothetical protein
VRVIPEGFSTESLSVAEIFIAGYLTAEWKRKNTAPTGQSADHIAAAYKRFIDEIRESGLRTSR